MTLPSERIKKHPRHVKHARGVCFLLQEDSAGEFWDVFRRLFPQFSQSLNHDLKTWNKTRLKRHTSLRIQVCKRLNLHIFQVLKWFYRPNFGGTTNIKQCAFLRCEKVNLMIKTSRKVQLKFRFWKRLWDRIRKKFRHCWNQQCGDMQPTKKAHLTGIPWPEKNKSWNSMRGSCNHHFFQCKERWCVLGG